MAYLSQDGIRSSYKSINYSTDNLFTGVWRLDQNNLNRFDPFIAGYAAIIWTALPAFFDKAEAGKDSSNFRSQFKYFTERNFKSFSGISDLSLEAEDISNGFAGNSLGVATNMKKENTSFTLRHYELAGSPVREMYQFWITGIRDPETGIATYHGAIASGELQYSMMNHTGELLYVVTDPSFASGGSTGIEFAAYYTNAFPTKIPQDQLNYSSGDHGVSEIDVEFRACFHIGSAINNLAVSAMEKYKLNKTYSDYGNLSNGGELGSGIAISKSSTDEFVGYGI